MTFDPNIPQANDIISVSQGEIQTNFSQLNTIFDVDHVTFNDVTASNRGKHDKATFVNQAADPVTAANELAVYAKDVGGTPSLFIRQQSNGTVYQFSGPTPSASASGHTWLPGDLLLQWGTNNALWNGTNSITFPIAFSAPAFSVTANMLFVNTTIREFVLLSSIGAASWTPRLIEDGGGNVGNARTIYWMAIGLA